MVKSLTIVPSDEEVMTKAKEQLDEIKKSFETDEQYQNALKSAGVTEESFLEEIKPAIISNIVYEDVIKDVTVTDEEIKTYYDSNQTLYTESPNRVRPANIVVKTEEEAKEVIERLDNGEDFAKIAAEKNTDATKDTGGDLDWIEYNSKQFDKTFLMAAISLNKGEYTKTPVSTKFGFHVIKCLDKIVSGRDDDQRHADQVGLVEGPAGPANAGVGDELGDLAGDGFGDKRYLRTQAANRSSTLRAA